MWMAIKTWFITNYVWVRIWPIAREIVNIISDGKITKEEVKLAVDHAFGDKDEVKLW